MKLYEIKQSYIDFMAAIESGDIPDEAIQDTLESIQGEFEDKADNIACLIKSLNAESKSIKAEQDALQERRERKDKQADSLKKYLSDAMQALGQMKLETPRNSIGFRKSTSLFIENEDDFKLRYYDLCKVEQRVSIPKAEITKLIKGGSSFVGVELKENQNIQIG